MAFLLIFQYYSICVRLILKESKNTEETFKSGKKAFRKETKKCKTKRKDPDETKTTVASET